MVKEKKDIRKKKGAYTIEDRIETVRILIENNYNFYKTSHQTGVSTSSLRAWSAQYGKEMESNNKIGIIAESVEINLARMKTSFITAHYEKMNNLAEKAISRALVLVENEEDLNKVNGTIKVISEFFTKATGENNEEGSKNSSLTLIEQTILQLNSANK